MEDEVRLHEQPGCGSEKFRHRAKKSSGKSAGRKSFFLFQREKKKMEKKKTVASALEASGYSAARLMHLRVYDNRDSSHQSASSPSLCYSLTHTLSQHPPHTHAHHDHIHSGTLVS
jgi:hypothetical protein